MKKALAAIGLLLFSVVDAFAADASYRHIVLFKFKSDAPAAEIEKVEKAFVALKNSIDQIEELEWGTNVSPEGKADGFTHCFFVTFKSKADLEAYLPHPEHQKFGASLKGLIDKVLVFDYVAKSVE
ncbi:MAG: Dabb family protein [Opitutaceae bacterium]|nr:Dabb family protein [Verrucomicrobiales bacterium]